MRNRIGPRRQRSYGHAPKRRHERPGYGRFGDEQKAEPHPGGGDRQVYCLADLAGDSVSRPRATNGLGKLEVLRAGRVEELNAVLCVSCGPAAPSFNGSTDTADQSGRHEFVESMSVSELPLR